MGDDKRIEINNIERKEEELTTDEAKDVSGGVQGNFIGTNVGVFSGNTVGGSIGSDVGNTVGGALGGDVSNPIKRG
jgi:outer membrane lipoprotein SlyB